LREAAFLVRRRRVGDYKPGGVGWANLKKNADGSVEVFFGPSAPAGKEANWIYTAPGRQWVARFRFYGPEKAVFEKTWKLPDIEKVSR